MVIIGSTALKHWFPDDYNKEPKDLDIVIDPFVTSFDGEGELHPVDSGTMNWFERYSIGDYLTPDGLYTLKVSHVPWEGKNGKWWKHMKDIKFLSEKDCKLIPEFHQYLLTYWSNKFGNKDHITFAKKDYDFFDDSVKRKYDHDSLHQLFKIEDVPAYTRILVEPGSALCSEEKFLGLSDDHKFHTILEEMFVLSVERSILLTEAYKKIVTSMSKGFWNTFIIENVGIILDGYIQEKINFIERAKTL